METARISNQKNRGTTELAVNSTKNSMTEVVESELIVENENNALVVFNQNLPCSMVNTYQGTLASNLVNTVFTQNIQDKVKKENATRLMNKYIKLYNYEIAEKIVDSLLLDNQLHSLVHVKQIDGEFEEEGIGDIIYNAVQYGNFDSIEICDPIEPDTEQGTIYLNNIFDAVYKTTARGGEEYRIIYGGEHIKSIVQLIVNNPNFCNLNKTFFIESLASNFALRDIESKHINNIVEVLIENKLLDTYNDFKIMIQRERFTQERNNISKNIPEYEIDALVLLQDIAVIDNNGKMEYVNITAFDYKAYSKNDLKQKFAKHSRLYINEDTGRPKKMNPAEVYLESMYRKEFDGVVFDPSSTCSANIFNTFKGFKRNPVKTIDISLYKEFILETICSGDQLMFYVTWSFLAQVFQNPHIKMGTALVLVSDKGAGKNMFVKPIVELMNGYSMVAKDHKYLLGNFNKHLENTLLFVADEADFTSSKKIVDGLKHIITETDNHQESKGVDAKKGIKNYTHLIVLANSTPVEQTEDERRFINCEVSNKRIGDLKYFNELDKLYNTEGFYESLLYELMSFDYSPWSNYLRKPPVNKVTLEQIELSKTNIIKWWKHCLEKGVIPYVKYEITYDGKLNISNEEKFKSFNKWCKEFNYKHNFDLGSFGAAFLKDVFYGNKKLYKSSKTSTSAGRDNSKVFKKLSKCRNEFVEKHKVTLQNTTKKWQECPMSTLH